MVQYTSPGQAQRGLPNRLSVSNAQSTVAGAGVLATAVSLSVVGGATVSFDGSASKVLPTGNRFGTGAPSTLVGEGVFYFDTATTPYTQYIQHSGAWRAL